ncbi:hypothetical protein UVI_02004350 [Ustilaginoidea virens]|uniref:C2H2-type transcription factor MSN2 n=1 Tax=Ustilaginoidea virens TaxID=1159556 RepID=A0A1B5KSH1_USTVR|nr:hypothetical protein UVI_02004350 [Ustilaginoidea virens]
MSQAAAAQNPTLYFNDSKMANLAHQKMNAFQAVAPTSPAYSRPGSSCSQLHSMYGSIDPAVMTPTGPLPSTHKPAIMLETEFADNPYFPCTPPLSASGSTVGSPRALDVLQTPLNPMFSGLDGFAVKAEFEAMESSMFDWASCDSPPMTPVSAPANPTFAPEFTVAGLGEAEVKSEHVCIETSVLSEAAFEYNPGIPSAIPALGELSDLESEDEFSSLMGAGEVSRPRACTGSSVVSLGHGSFIGDQDLSFDEKDEFQFASRSSRPCSVEAGEDTHQDKRQKKSKTRARTKRSAQAKMHTAAAEGQSADSEEQNDQGSPAATDSNSSSSGAGSPAAPASSAPINRRGRKQSLTEDPSKTFVCDLCNRRFRRQEHLKRHYRSLHTQEKPFECNECGKKFSRSDNLAQHARTHSSGGAIVMSLVDGTEAPCYEDATAGAPVMEDFANYGKVLFQIASEVPGSASELSSEEGSDSGKKKRKRSD